MSNPCPTCSKPGQEATERQRVLRAANQPQTLIGQTCGICGRVACGVEHKVMTSNTVVGKVISGPDAQGIRTVLVDPSVSLPHQSVQATAQSEDTRLDFWTVCPACKLVRAYCRC